MHFAELMRFLALFMEEFVVVNLYLPVLHRSCLNPVFPRAGGRRTAGDFTKSFCPRSSSSFRCVIACGLLCTHSGMKWVTRGFCVSCKRSSKRRSQLCWKPTLRCVRLFIVYSVVAYASENCFFVKPLEHASSLLSIEHVTICMESVCVCQ